MTAKKTKAKSAPAKKSRSKPSAAVKTGPAEPIRSAGEQPEPCAAAGAAEAETPAVTSPSGSGAVVQKIITGSMISLSVKRVICEVILIAAVVLALQLGWSAVKLAGRSIAIFRQFRQWQEWSQENVLPIPGPDNGGIRKYIRKNSPRTIPAAERETAAQVFADAAAAVESGELINRDDVLGYLGENLRPVCKAPAWIGFLSDVWTELDFAADAEPETLSKALREVSQSLNEARAFPLVEAVEELTVSEAEVENEPVTVEESAESVLAPEALTETEPAGAPAENKDCSTGNCPSGKVPKVMRYYDGYSWRWAW